MRKATHMNHVVEITSAEFEERVLRSPVPALVDFYAEWCGPCRLLDPILAEIADELEGQVAVFKVNAPENTDLVKQISISALPTVCVFEKGNEVARLVGLQNKERLLPQIPTIPNPVSRA
jgi:thioredoxin 1